MHRTTLWILLAVFALLSLASFAGRFGEAFELLSHFRPQWVVAALIAALVLALARLWLAVPVALALAALHLWPLLPYLAGPRPAAAEGMPVRVLILNLQHRHGDMDRVRKLLAEERPDIALFTELLWERAGALEGLLPHRLALGEPPFNLLLLSRWPIADVRTAAPLGPRFPVLAARVCPSPQSCFDLIGLHAARPLMGRINPRDRMLDAAAGLAGDAPTILAGDLNLTPWSPVFAGLLARAGLRDSGQGRGLRPTWLSRHPLLGLPIDHVLVGGRIGVRDRRIGPDIGSDHLPVIADLTLPFANR